MSPAQKSGVLIYGDKLIGPREGELAGSRVEGGKGLKDKLNG